MGGGLIIFAVLIPCLVWMDLSNMYTWLALGIFSSYGLLGFLDDYRKISKKNSRGVSGKQKLFFQVFVALIACSIHHFILQDDGIVSFPFIKDITINLGFWYILFGAFVIVGASNAVNLTDGLDGLALSLIHI